MAIKHVWFDFSETIAGFNNKEHNKLRYATYAKLVGKPNDSRLQAEFNRLYERDHSVSGIFHSLGKPAGWWSEQIAAVDPSKLYKLMEDDIPDVLQEIKQHVPISIFSNIELGHVLPALGIKLDWFTHILSSGKVGRPKPALDGFYKIIDLSQLPPNEILYIGDHVTKDVIPAKKVGLKAGIIWDQSDRADYSFKSFREILDLFLGSR